jgi:hypothetical protein
MGATEVIFLTFVFKGSCCGGGIDCHVTDWVDHGRLVRFCRELVGLNHAFGSNLLLDLKQICKDTTKMCESITPLTCGSQTSRIRFPLALYRRLT